MSAHTPGPWSIGMSCDMTPAVCVPVPPGEGSSFVVAHINRMPRMGIVQGCAEANARLIAAAPELLAALRAILDECSPDKRPYSTESWLPDHLLADARAAISKAEAI
jgi:hypothetical protein